ncbi:YceI family protein [Leptospira yasudae]|uniref:YceI family protein n=1 Tax=Leptospira yasudae TaxID=2202201 RepID=A0A6N4QJC0_9LEPT|nr:YceI family protein [Leptospira yasudae]TGL77186.1 YceI family protein [Leptospira yasudae]TGL80486.1 YceI family protein [Leptospira yasudae]TGL85912.1 YceI family protein [Leptospira yasudae]
MKKLRQIVFLVSLLFVSQTYASEILKKEITFLAIHPMKEVHGICKEVNSDSPNIQSSGTGYKLNSPFAIKIPILRIHSGDESRDSHIMEILGYPDTPEIAALIESVTPSGDSYSIRGKLTIHGLTRDFESRGKVEQKEPGQIRVFGKVNITFSDFKLEKPSLLFIKAKEEIEIGYDFLIKI